MPSLSETQDKWFNNTNAARGIAVQAVQDSQSASDYVGNWNNYFDDVSIDTSTAQAVKWALAVGSEAYPESLSPGDTVTLTIEGEETEYEVPNWSESVREGVQQAMEENSYANGVEQAADRSTNVSLDV
jgi:hypothetical protein